jgi:hypothetical protein
MTDSLTADLDWFLDHADGNVPERIHSRGVWSDAGDGLGSKLGTPKHYPAFEAWLLNGERATSRVEDTVLCSHPFMGPVERAAGQMCTACGVRDEAGAIVSESGVYTTTRDAYRWPMRATLARLRHATVKRDRPNLASTLFQIGVAGGDLARAAETLAHAFPVMGDPATARAHFAFALHRARVLYFEFAPPRPTRDVAA